MSSGNSVSRAFDLLVEDRRFDLKLEGPCWTFYTVSALCVVPVSLSRFHKGTLVA